MGVGRLSPYVAKAGGLCPHHYGRAAFHIGVVVETGVLELRRKYLYVAFLQKVYAFRRLTRHARHGEDASYAAAYEIRVIEVRKRVAYYEGVGPCRIGASKDRSQITRLLHAFQDCDERIFLKSEVFQSVMRGDHFGDYAFRAFSICDFIIYILAYFVEASFAVELGENVGIFAFP